MARKVKAEKRIVVLDIETDPFRHGRLPRPFLWGTFDGTVQRFFTSAEETVAYLRTLKPCIVYAHNGGRFDFHYLAHLAEHYEPILAINGRVAKFMIDGIEFRDSYCILPVPLASYNKTSIDYDLFEEDKRGAHMDEIKRYLADDCRFLHELVLRFRASYADGITLATCAMKFWLAQSGKLKPISDRTYYEKFAPFYYGGRVQCFTKGLIAKPFRMYDINSAYPRAMLEEHPFNTDPVLRSGKGKAVIGPSLYAFDGISKGALPYRDAHGLIYYPDDDMVRRYTVTGWEVQAGLRTGTLKVKHWDHHWFYEERVSFRTYINHFYEMKKAAKIAGDKAAYLFAKLFMNSLYGKFCANPDKYDNLAVIPQHDVVEVCEDPGLCIGRLQGPWRSAGLWGQDDPVAGILAPALISNRLSDKDPRFDLDDQEARILSDWLNVSTGASITGWVRAYLWEAICRTRAAGGEVLYCDTDSVTCSLPDQAPVVFPLSDLLGDWTLEGHFDSGAIAGKKLYAFHKAGKKGGGEKDWKTATKGSRLTADQVLAVARGEKVIWRNDAPTFRLLSEPTFLERTIAMT